MDCPVCGWKNVRPPARNGRHYCMDCDLYWLELLRVKRVCGTCAFDQDCKTQTRFPDARYRADIGCTEWRKA